MVGEGVSRKEEPGVARYACLIHTANWARDLDGCIAPGTSIRYFGGGQAVADSRHALDRIDEILKTAKDPRIEIVSLWGTG